MSWLYLSNPCAFSVALLHTVLRAQSAPGFPCALSWKEGATRCKTRENQSAGTIALTLMLFEIRIRVFPEPVRVLWRWLVVIPGRAKREP